MTFLSQQPALHISTPRALASKEEALSSVPPVSSNRNFQWVDNQEQGQQFVLFWGASRVSIVSNSQREVPHTWHWIFCLKIYSFREQCCQPMESTLFFTWLIQKQFSYVFFIYTYFFLILPLTSTFPHVLHSPPYLNQPQHFLLATCLSYACIKYVLFPFTLLSKTFTYTHLLCFFYLFLTSLSTHSNLNTEFKKICSQDIYMNEQCLFLWALITSPSIILSHSTYSSENFIIYFYLMLNRFPFCTCTTFSLLFIS